MGTGFSLRQDRLKPVPYVSLLVSDDGGGVVWAGDVREVACSSVCGRGLQPAPGPAEAGPHVSLLVSDDGGGVVWRVTYGK